MATTKSMRLTEDDDTEGHGSHPVRKVTEDEDTEGHDMLANPIINQQLARAREQEIQRGLRAQQQRAEATRPHKK